MNENQEAIVGKTVVYRSKSGKEYDAVVTGIPENPVHGYTHLPTVSLEFRDERKKLVRKERATPYHAEKFSDPPYWRPKREPFGWHFRLVGNLIPIPVASFSRTVPRQREGENKFEIIYDHRRNLKLMSARVSEVFMEFYDDGRLIEKWSFSDASLEGENYGVNKTKIVVTYKTVMLQRDE